MKHFLAKIRRFIRALLFHIGAGMPKSTQDQINHRYLICLSCDSFDKNNAQCMECGCNINNKRIFMNKLAWADQQCPLNKWNKIL